MLATVKDLGVGHVWTMNKISLNGDVHASNENSQKFRVFSGAAFQTRPMCSGCSCCQNVVAHASCHSYHQDDGLRAGDINVCKVIMLTHATLNSSFLFFSIIPI